MEFPSTYSIEHLLESSDLDVDDDDDEPDEKFKCKICKKEFAKKDLLKTHEKTHGPRAFQCKVCDFRFTTKKYLTLHTRRRHSDKNTTHKYKCDFCDKLFFSKRALTQHELIHTGGKPNKCEICGKCFRAKFSLGSHMLIHTGEKPFKCAFCDYACRDNSTLRRHQERHLGIVTKIKCTECNMCFDKKLRLRVHVDEVHLNKDVMKFKCTECGKGFKYKTSMNDHKQRVHTTKLNMKCEICHSTISNKYNLRLHMETHNTYKPYKCGVGDCTRRFKTNQDCRRHRINHFPDQQHKCDKCDARFITKSKLKRHAKYVHRYKPPQYKHVECGHCGVKFYSKTYLRNHIKIKHDLSLPKLYCDHCEFTCQWKPSLIMHMKGSHLKEYYPTCYVCSVCGISLDSQQTFRRHMFRRHRVRLRRRLKIRKEVTSESSVIVKEEPIDIEENNLNDVLEEAEQVEIPLSENVVLKELVDSVDEDIMSEDENTKRYRDKDVYDKYQKIYREVRVRKISRKPLTLFTDKKLLLKPIVLLDRTIADNYKININNSTLTKKVSEAVKREADKVLKSKQIEALEMMRCVYNDRLREIIELRKLQEDSTKKNKIVLKRVKVKNDDDERINDEKGNNSIEHNINHNTQVKEIDKDKLDDEPLNCSEISSKDDEITQNTSQKGNDVTNRDISSKNNEINNEIAVEKEDSNELISNDDEALQDDNDVLRIDDEMIKAKEHPNIIKQFENELDKTLFSKNNDRNEQSNNRLCSIEENNISSNEKTEITSYEEVDRIESVNEGTESVNSSIISKNTVIMFANNTHKRLSTEESSNSNVNITELSNKLTETSENNDEINKTKQLGEDNDIDISISKDNEDFSEVNGINKELKKLNPRKIKFNTVQCYVCFKLFPTKEDLIQHCQTHFDVCSVEKLIKCPLCSYVGRQYIKRHMITAHNMKLDVKYSKINKNEQISVYTEEVLHQENINKEVSGNSEEVSENSKVSVSQIEVIPSVMNLNRNESMKLDSDIRARKKMNTFENVLVRKGTEWIVSREVVKIDLEKHMFPKILKTHKINSVFKFKDDNPYIEDLMKLRAQARRDNVNIVFPCNSCTKICRNIAALKAHIKTHDDKIKYKKRPKEFMDKYFKKDEKKKGRKQKKNSDKIEKKSNKVVSGNSVKSGNSTSGNLPNTKEEVVEFFNNNIGGTDQELQEFLKIFTQIDKIDKNEFSVIEHNEEFGVQ